MDEPNQGNTLLSAAPLPQQEPIEKPTSNGESLESTPTNGHSATQAPVADSEMWMLALSDMNEDYYPT